MGDPFKLGPLDGSGTSSKNELSRLQEDAARKFIDQLASAPSPSDRINSQYRNWANSQGTTQRDNVAAPDSTANGGTVGVRPFGSLLGGPVDSRINVPQPQPIRTDVPILHGDPNKEAPSYPGGIGPDGRVVGTVIGATGPAGRILWDAFTKTYNDRSRENVLPRDLPLVEVAPQAAARIHHWMLMGDSEMSQPRAEYNGRNLRPGPEQKGHVFAVGVNKEGNPINVLEYYWGDKTMVYAGQYQISYSRDNQGNMHSRIDHYNADQSSAPSPKARIGNSFNTYEGSTEYVSNARNQIVSMQKFDYINPNVAKVGITFDQNGAHKVWRDANSGRLVEQGINPGQVKQTVNALSNQFYFRNLFGP